MRLSFTISLEDKKPHGLSESPYWQRKLSLLGELGYAGVELAIRDPGAVNIGTLEKSLSKNKLELSAIGTGQVYIYDNLSLSSLKDEARIKAIKRLKQHIDLANIFKTQVIIGLIRGKTEQNGGSKEACIRYLLGSMKRICDYAALKNVVLTVEPINRYETDFLNNVGEAISFIKKIKYKNLKILLDTFHMNIEEKDICGAIKEAAGFINHLHFADNNRSCPGKGHINFRQVINTLKMIGYKRYLSAEILPLSDFRSNIKEYIKNIQRYI